MTKQSTIKLAEDLSTRNVGTIYPVVGLSRGNGRKTYHVVRGGIEQAEQLAMRLSAHNPTLIGGYVAERRLKITPNK
jgi:hypothetical protein